MSRSAALVLALGVLAGLLDLRTPEATDASSEALAAVRLSRGAAITLIDLAESERLGSFLALRQHASGALLVTEPGATGSAQREPLDRTSLFALGEVTGVVERDLSGLRFPAGPPTRSGSALGGDWTLHLFDPSGPEAQPGHAPVLLARLDDGLLRIVDARLVPDLDPEAFELPAPAPRVVREVLRVRGTVVVDLVLLAVLLLAGGLILPRDRFSGLQRAFMALPVGVAALGAVGLLRLPALWPVVVAVALLVLTGRKLHRRGVSVGWVRADAGALLLLGTVAALVAAMTRVLGLIWTSGDSIVYLAQARLLADGRLTTDLIRVKRGLAQQQLHAPGFALGAEGFHSLGPVMLVVAVGILALSGSSVMTSRSVSARLIPALAGGLLLFSPAIPQMAAYVNSHLLVAVLLLVLVVLLGIGPPGVGDPADGSGGASEPSAALVPAVGVVVTAIVLLRPEGTLLVGLVLLGTLRGDGPSINGHWRWLGSATILWNLLIAHGRLQRGEGIALPVLAMLGVGGLLLIVPFVLRWLERLGPAGLAWRSRLPISVNVALWAAAVGLILRDRGDIAFVGSVTANLGEGYGRWGTVGILLALLAIAAVVAPEQSRDGPGVLGARWALIGFVPLALLTKLGDGLERVDADVATLLRGGGRIGWGDSVNRAWTHVMLLILLLFIFRAIGEGTAARLRSSAALRIVGASIAVIAIAGTWAPFFAPDDELLPPVASIMASLTLAVPIVVTLLVIMMLVLLTVGPSDVDRDPGPVHRWRRGTALVIGGVLLLGFPSIVGATGLSARLDPAPGPLGLLPGPLVPAGELVAGAEIVQPIPGRAMRDPLLGRAGGSVCVDVLLANYGDRPNDGTLVVGLRSGGLTEEMRVEMGSIADNAWSRSCFDAALLRENGPAPLVALTLRGEGSRQGSSVTAWLRPLARGEEAAQLEGFEGLAVAGSDHQLAYRMTAETGSRSAATIRLIGLFALVGGLVGLAASSFGPSRARRPSGVR